MNQQYIIQELKAIEAALANFKQGASIEDIKAAIEIDIEVRTLQRRLDKLQEQGIVQTSGKRRSTLYYLVQDDKRTIAADDSIIPLSAAGMEIKQALSQPIGKRRLVGYNIDFLISYRPNKDSYLTITEKKKLAELGKTASLDQPAGTYAKEILQRLLIDLSWNSSRLEGNTYSLLDTQRLISQGHVADNKTDKEAQMILNHKDAIEFIVQDAEEIGFNRYTLTSLHSLLSDHLLPNPAASGRLRTFGVGITNSVFTPLGIPQQIEEMFEIILARTEKIENPFEQAFFVMVHLPYLQPFDDVNKRVSRLAANIALNKHNLAPLAFVDVPKDIYVQGMLGVYELNRIELLKDVFMWAYERSSLRYAALRQTLGNPDPFRLKYRSVMRELVHAILFNAMSHHEAIAAINQRATTLPQSDQTRFIEMIETELLSLHDGNFARYRVSPTAFKRWKEVWETR